MILNYDHTFAENAECEPDIFIYLKKNDKCLCFIRLNASLVFNQLSDDYNVYPFKVDRSCVSEDDFPDYHAGFLRARLTVFSGYLKIDHWIPPSNSDQKTPIRIIANLIRAIDLPSGDDNGLSDPFVELEHYGNTKFSTVCNKTLDPIWNQRIVLDSYSIQDKIMPLIINVYDSDSDDPLKQKYEFLGRKILDVPVVFCTDENKNVVPKPEWYQLENSEKLKMGKIFISLQLFPQTVNPESLFPLAFNKMTYFLKFKLLGLRNYVSAGIFPIKRPYIKINLSACKGEEAASNNLNMLTSNSKSGNSDANFSEIIK